MEQDRAVIPVDGVMNGVDTPTPDSPPCHTPPGQDRNNEKNEEAPAQDTANDGEEENQYEYPTGIKLASILAGSTLAYYLLFLDLAIISTATPAITTQFNDLIDIGWYAGAYQLASAALQPLTGKIYTYFSLKVMSMFALPIPFP